MKEFLEKNASEVLNMLFTEFDMDTAIETWKEEGRKEGIKEGFTKGEIKKQMEIAKNLIAILDVKDVNIISKATGLSIDEIKKLM